MKGKTSIIICCTIIVFLLIIHFVSKSGNQKCGAENCDNGTEKGQNFCIEHTCKYENCFAIKNKNKEYCDYHYRKENCKLTENEIKICNQLIKEYISNLKTKQHNISEVINNTVVPITYYDLSSEFKIQYDVFVYFTNDLVKTGHLYLCKNGSQFKVEGIQF